MENKKNNAKKRKMSKQTILTIGMIMVSIFVITVASYAWYLISNTPKITNAEFVADTIGNLRISNEAAGTYGNEIPLYTDDMNKYRLSPVTTKNGKEFVKPVYTEGAITDLVEFTSEDKLTTDYIYERVFYLKAGDDNGSINNDAKYYNIKLVGMSTEEKNRFAEQTEGNPYQTDYEKYYNDTSTHTYVGSFMHDKIVNDNPTSTAANAIRISFTFTDATNTEKVVVYEPNYDKHNTETPVDDSNCIVYTKPDYDGNYTVSQMLRQSETKSFKYTENENTVGTDEASKEFATIKEGTPVKVTMRVWIEGTDEDCINGIAADTLVGQIQFISEENKTFTPPTTP